MGDFMVIQVICVVLALAFPRIAMWFPEWLREGDRMSHPAQWIEEGASGEDALEAGDQVEEKH